MASGFNGQGFTFHGYLPIKTGDRVRKLKELERQAQTTGFTQSFIETPFRNDGMLKDILQSCQGGTLLSVACALTTPEEFIASKTVGEWQKNIPMLLGKPCVFSIWSNMR
jgi:16S rRNA (cytidine1402-2'-O)-methyltransferase